MMAYAVIGLGIALAATVAGAGWKIDSLKDELKVEKAEVVRLVGDLKTSRDNVATLEVSVKDQNQKIDDLFLQRKVEAEMADAEIMAAREKTRQADVVVTKLLFQHRPAGLTACQNAERLLDEAIIARRGATGS